MKCGCMANNQYTYNQPQIGQMQPSPQPPMPMGRRARMGKRLMAGVALNKNQLPGWFATYAIATYAIALLGIYWMYSDYAMEWYFWLFGIAWVVGFFLLSVKFSQDWSLMRVRKSKVFERKLFWTGFLIRAIYAIFIYFFYVDMTGQPHEFQAGDSVFYMELGEDWLICLENGTLWSNLVEYSESHFSDMGYPLFILLHLRMYGLEASYIIVRLIHAIFGAYTAVIIYRLTARSMGESTARIAAIFCMLHPILICYAGMMLKEVFMTWLIVLFIDLADRMLRNRKYTFSTIAPLVFVGFLLFMFRTVLGMIAFIALFFSLVMIDSKIISLGRKIILGILLAGVLVMAASDTIMREIRYVTDTDISEVQQKSLEFRYGEKKGKQGEGNTLAKYAGTAVFAPLIFTIPFPTMVSVDDQEDMRLIHGGNWARNVVSGVVILAMVMLLLTGDWRKYTLPLAMLLGYLLMLAFTQFAHSLRFHIPVMPFEMMFAAYAITNMRKKHKNWYLIWCFIMVVACFAWNWYKLAGRGLT